MLRATLLAAVCILACAADPDPGWGREPVEEGGGIRAAICLNGLWRFQPGQGDTPAAGWGWIRVPGAWAVRNVRLPGVTARGEGWTVAGADAASPAWNAVARGWYERELAVPAAWAGRRIVLDLDRVATDATVWVDGAKAGTVAWPGGSLDLTAQVHPGATAILRILVIAAGDGAEVTEHTGSAADQVFGRKTTLSTRGITGDVVLRSEPTGGRIAGVAVRTSVRQGRIDLDLELAGAGGAVAVQARMLDQAGAVEKSFAATATPAADGTCTVGWQWPDARRWDIGRPERYTLELAVRGPGIDDLRREPFGFREVWIEGRRIMLNGSEWHPRPAVVQVSFDQRICTREGVAAVIDGFRATGFDSQELWPWDPAERGAPSAHRLWCERAAEVGYGVFAPLPGIAPVAGDWPRGEAAWTAAVARWMRPLRNNPAVLLWVHSPNQFGPRTDQDPRVLGDRAALTAASDAARIAPGLAAQAIIRRLDPTRPAAAHQGGAVGDLQAVNFYPCLQQTQEVEEWLTRYLAAGDMPFWPVEFGPFYLDYRRGRLAGGWGRPQGAIYTELLATEHLAAAYGAEAYRQETEQLRGLNPSHHEQAQRYRDIYKTWLSPLADRDSGEQILRTVRAWRILGAPALPIPWEFELGWNRRAAADGTPADAAVPAEPFSPGLRGAWLPALPAAERFWLQPRGSSRGARGDAIAIAYAPTLACIAGAARDGDPGAATAKDHVFTAGGALAKRAALVNDTRAEQPWRLRWSVRVGGAVAGSGEASGRIATGAVAWAPIACPLPAAGAGALEIEAAIGDAVHRDRLAITVLPPAPAADLDVAVIDPAGDSTALLRRLGCRPADPAPGRLLVVGRNALVRGAAAMDDLRARAAAGARILVLAQDPQWLRDTLGWRVGHQVVRRVFPVDPAHPVLAGLDADALADWAGAGSLVAAQPAVEAPPKGYPRYGWHWGNRGSVSSAMIEKPHRSGWRPILEGDVDLACTPLMELELGAGRIVWCGLDLEARGADEPAADRLALNLVRYAASEPAPRRGCRLSGDRRLLDAAGAVPAADGALLVVASGGDRAAAEAHLAAGGTVLCLAPEAMGLATAERADAGGTPAVPAWPWCRGLSPSDLHLRGPWKQRELAPAEGLEIAADGLLGQRRVGRGLLAVCLLDPGSLPADERTWLRWSRWRRTHALALVLANLGAGFATDAFPKTGWYHPDWIEDQQMGDDPHRYYRW